MPITRHPYISAVADEATILSDPPSTTSKYFMFNDLLAKSWKIESPINVACHANHMRGHKIDWIIGDRHLWQNTSIKNNVQFLGIHTGKPVMANDLQLLLAHCVDEILNKRSNWGTVVEQLCSSLKESCEAATIHAVGPVCIAHNIEKRIKHVGVSVSIAENIHPSFGKSPILRGHSHHWNVCTTARSRDSRRNLEYIAGWQGYVYPYTA